MDQIRQSFANLVDLTKEDWDLFSSKLERKDFPKNYSLVKTGQIENYLSFIEKGIIRFYIPGEDNDLTFAFAFENSFVSAYDSFITRSISKYHVGTLSKTVLWRLSYNDLQEIYRNTSTGNTIGRYAAEDLFLKKAKRELTLLNETPEQRYLNLLSESPHLIQEIPLKYLASYIGITPQALSRIRKRIIS